MHGKLSGVTYEIVEHTADVGVRADGPTLEDAFRETTLGLLDITGTWAPERSGEDVDVSLSATDHGSLLVDWLGEVLYLQDARDSVVSGVSVDLVSESEVRGVVTLAPRGDVSPEGTAVKAITYHQLAVEHAQGAWQITVFVDV